MKLSTRSSLTFLVALILIFPAYAQSASLHTIYLPLMGSSGSPPSTPQWTEQSARQEMIRLVNDARVEAGCPAATVNAILMDAAQAWSIEMIDVGLVHSYTAGDWYPDHGYPAGALEAIGGGAVPQQVFDSFMMSPAHRDILLFCPYDPSQASYDIGVGAATQGTETNFAWTVAIGVVLQ